MSALWKVIVREMHILLGHRVYLLAMVGAPLLTCLFFTTLMRDGQPHDLPLGVVDEDGTATTRSLVRNLDAFQAASVAGRYASVREARRAMQRGDIYAFYLIPRGTTARLVRGESPAVSFYANDSYLIAGSLLYRDMRMVSELAAGAAVRTTLRARGATEAQSMAFLQPIAVDTHPVSNPSLNYNVYLSTTLLPGMLALFVMLVTAYSLGMEVKFGGVKAWLAAAQGSLVRALAGKLLAQTAVFMLTACAIAAWLFGALRFPCHAGLPVMIFVLLLLVAGAQGLAVVFFAALLVPRMAMSAASLWGVLSFSLCGMTFPVMAMHPVLQGLSYLFPLRHYFLLYVNCALDGHPLSAAWPFAAALGVFALLPWLCLPVLSGVLGRTEYKA